MKDKKNKKKTLPLENLFLAELGHKISEGSGYKFSPIKKPHVLVRKDYYGDYIDAITGTKYDEFSSYSSRFCIYINGPVSQALKNDNLKQQGYIEYEFALELLEFYNDPEGYNKKQQQKKQQQKAQEVIESQKSKYGQFLPNNNFAKKTYVSREKELSKLVLALGSNYKNVVVVGEPGVGKTTLVNQLAYNMNNYNVPGFLRNKPVLEIKNEDFRKKILKGKNIDSVLKYAKKTKAIILFDEVQEIFDEKNKAYGSLFEKALDFEQIKIIATTTQLDYDKYFSRGDISTKFEKVYLDEPSVDVLQKIVSDTFDEYSSVLDISLPDEKIKNIISEILIVLTNKRNRREFNNIIYDDYNYRLSNPQLLIDIIDESFAFARVEDSSTLEIDNIIQAIKQDSRFKENIIEEMVDKLEKLKVPIETDITSNLEENTNKLKLKKYL